MIKPLTYTPSDLTHEPGLTVGGKARGLLALAEAGLRVPPFRVLPAEMAVACPWDDEEGLRSLARVFDALAVAPFAGVAVRSSATIEDSAERSWAGIFDTVFVRERLELAGAVKQVAASASCAEEEGGASPPMAVVLQAMVVPEMAGVLFSADPRAARYDACYVEAVHGPGSGLVDGSKVPSRFLLNMAPGGPSKSMPGPDGPPRLDADLARELRDALLRIEIALEAPADIEWAVDNSGLWLLQARPVTALTAHEDLRPSYCATCWFFDQRFAEPIGPLTRTSLLPLIAEVAITDALAMRSRPAPAPLLHFYGGQAYVAHSTYRAMLDGAPRWFLHPDLRQLFPEHCCCPPGQRSSAPALHYAWCAFTSVIRHWRDVFFNGTVWKRFRRNLAAELAEMPPVSPELEAPWCEQWRRLDTLTLRFLRIHRWSILWANYFHGGFQLLTRCLPGRLRRGLEQRLHAATDLVTARANAALASVLRGDAGEAEWAAFVEQYGRRSPSLDYAAPTWAELAASDRLQNWYDGALPPPARPEGKAPVWASLLRPLCRLLEMREEQRFEWESILARQRGMLLDAGETLHRQGVLEDPEDIWFLEWGELMAALFGDEEVCAESIALRKHRHYIDTRIDTPFFIGPERDAPAAKETPAAMLLQGFGASPGVVRGKAVVIRRISELKDSARAERIVVMASLDPAWTPFLAGLKGIVLERGGVLSHAAILAREYGVPMVIGVEKATQRIEEGAEITIDGIRGRVALHTVAE